MMASRSSHQAISAQGGDAQTSLDNGAIAEQPPSDALAWTTLHTSCRFCQHQLTGLPIRLPGSPHESIEVNCPACRKLLLRLGGNPSQGCVAPETFKNVLDESRAHGSSHVDTTTAVNLSSPIFPAAGATTEPSAERGGATQQSTVADPSQVAGDSMISDLPSGPAIDARRPSDGSFHVKEESERRDCDDRLAEDSHESTNALGIRVGGVPSDVVEERTRNERIAPLSTHPNVTRFTGMALNLRKYIRCQNPDFRSREVVVPEQGQLAFSESSPSSQGIPTSEISLRGASARSSTDSFHEALEVVRVEAPAGGTIPRISAGHRETTSSELRGHEDLTDPKPAARLCQQRATISPATETSEGCGCDVLCWCQDSTPSDSPRDPLTLSTDRIDIHRPRDVALPAIRPFSGAEQVLEICKEMQDTALGLSRPSSETTIRGENDDKPWSGSRRARAALRSSPRSSTTSTGSLSTADLNAAMSASKVTYGMPELSVSTGGPQSQSCPESRVEHNASEDWPHGGSPNLSGTAAEYLSSFRLSSRTSLKSIAGFETAQRKSKTWLGHYSTRDD